MVGEQSGAGGPRHSSPVIIRHALRLTIALSVRPALASALAVLLVTLALYASTAAPTVSWRNGGADSAELVTASYTLGIAHPPGYPLYVLLGKAWSLLPLGEVARRYNLFSAACGALAAALVAVLASHLWRRTLSTTHSAWALGLPGTVAGLALAAAPAVWAQATVAEVYTLNLLLLAAVLWLLLRWSARRSVRPGVGLLVLAGLVLGFGMGNHVTLGFLVPIVVAYVASFRRDTPSPRQWLAVAAAFSVGLAVYAYLPLRAALGPASNWGDPSTPERFLRQVTAADYHGYLLTQPLWDVLLRVPVIARLLVEQFTWLGVAVLMLGLWAAWERLRREALLLATVALAYGLFALVYDAQGSQVYLLPAYLAGAVFVGLGAVWLWRQAMLIASSRWSRAIAPGVALLVILIPLARAVSAYPALDVSADREALSYALETLAAAPPGVPLYPRRDEQTFALWYAQQVLGVRPDVPVVDVRLLRFDWYRARVSHPPLDPA